MLCKKNNLHDEATQLAIERLLLLKLVAASAYNTSDNILLITDHRFQESAHQLYQLYSDSDG